MMCKVLIFGCIAAVTLMTAAYGAPTPDCGAPLTTELPPARRKEFLTTLICDLEQLKNIENVSGDFLLSEDSFVFIFFYVIFSEKLTFFPPSLQNFLEFYVPNDKQVSLNFLFSFNSI